jgi:hypothetical protein
MFKLPDPVVRIEFRDGERDIPAYLARLMSGLETFSMTYDDAVKIVNGKIASDHANRAMNRIVREHFRVYR